MFCADAVPIEFPTVRTLAAPLISILFALALPQNPRTDADPVAEIALVLAFPCESILPALALPELGMFCVDAFPAEFPNARALAVP